MFRRFIERTTNRQASGLEEGVEGQHQLQQQRPSVSSFQAKELSNFVACIEACDNLASTSTSSGRVEAKTGLTDCSVLVSADGDLLIIPRELSSVEQNKPKKNERTKSFLDQTSSDFGPEYQTAIFMGNDLNADGDKQLNGFTSKGWSIPATTLAVKQSADSMNDFVEFAQHLQKAKKVAAAQDGFLAKKLKSLTNQTPTETSKARAEEYQSMLNDAFPDHTVQLLPQRVGPLAFQEGSVHTTLNALENYYSHVAQSEANRWKATAEGPLKVFEKAKEQTAERELKRRIALKEMIQKKKTLEDHLAACKEDAIKRWNDVHDAEEKVTSLLEEKIMERNRQKEQKRITRMKEDEKKRIQDAANNGTTTSQDEIWDIVNAVAANMEEGSFEPMMMDMHHPADQSHASNDATTLSGSVMSEDDTATTSSMPMIDRHDLEQEQALPELRVAALTADEEVEDAAHALLQFLSEWDVTVRSSKLAAETCLIGACNAQAKCLRTIIDMERKAMQERMEQLEHLEAVAYYMDVRADLDNYIKLDKTESGGYSELGEEDDGGVAAAFGVLDDHVNGNLGLETDAYHDSMTAEDMENMLTAPDNMEEMMDIFFKQDSGLDVDPSAESEAMTEFEKSVTLLCQLGQDKTSAGRVHRSTICYALNAKRNSEDEVPTLVQFEGLCRLFSAVLSGCSAKTASSVKILMTLSQIFFMKDADGNKVLVKSKLINHPLWADDDLWDNVLYQDITENLTNSGLMENFDHHSARTKPKIIKKKGEWTENTKLKWHDLRDSDRYDAASQVHAVVFAQLGTMAHTMIEFGCGLHRSCAFVRRMAVRNQIPISQRTLLLQHLMGTEKDEDAK